MIDLDRRSLIAAGVGIAGAISPAALAAAVQPNQSSGHGAPLRFDGKVVAVTGATSGIGRAAAEQFAAEGAQVVFNGRRAALGAEVERAIRARGGDATYIQTDVREPDQLRRFFARIGELHGRLDAGVNNAGMQTINETDKTTLPEYDDMMLTNVRGVWLSVREEIALMRGRGGGAIVNTASIHAFASRPRLSIYSATKGAVMAMTRSLALELGQDGIRVNAVCPGPIDTPMMRRFATTDERRKEIADGVYGAKRLGTAKEAAEVIVWLASSRASFVSGAGFVVDGATLASI